MGLWTGIISAVQKCASSPSLEPQKAKNTSNPDLFLEDLRDGHASIDQLLAPLITDAGHEGSRFPDQTKLLEMAKE